MRVESDSHLNALLDDAEALATASSIGQLFHLAASPGEVRIAWIDLPDGGAGWALTYDNQGERKSVASVGQDARTGTDDEVDLRFADSWEQMPRGTFIDRVLARDAALEYFHKRRLAESVVWQRW